MLGTVTSRAVNAHVDELAARGLVTVAREAGRKYYATSLTPAGHAWLAEHHDEVELLEGE